MIGVHTREDGAARHWLVALPRRVWPEYEWLLLPFALPGFGDSYWGGMGCLCVQRGEHQSLWGKGGKKKGEGEREQELVRKRRREGASGSRTGLPLKHCSLSFCFSEETVFLFSPCPSLLLVPSLAAWPWPRWTPWSPCPPREEDRNAVAEEEGERREEKRGHRTLCLTDERVWKLINRRQHRRGQEENNKELKRANY